MNDTVIKGSGNSRTLKTVPNLAARAPTYDKLLELLTGEGLPIDLGPLNPAGLNVRGTDLNKETLLKDSTAALYGLGANATPDQILAKIQPYLNNIGKKGNCQFYSFTYVGTGASGPSGARTHTFPHKPIVVFIQASGYTAAMLNGSARAEARPDTSYPATLTWGPKSLTIQGYAGEPWSSFNTANGTYFVVALLDASQ